MPMLDELETYLVAETVATAAQIFQDWMPDRPDVCLVIYAEPGIAPSLGFGIEGIQFETPNVQIVTRATALDPLTAETLSWAAFNALVKIQGRVLGTTNYLIALPHQTPSGVTLGPDEKQRPRFSFNINMRKEPS